MNHGLQCDGTLNGLVALECEAFKDVMENENRMIISGHIFEYMEIGKRSFLVLFLFFLIFLICFIEPHPQHMEVPRLGAESELHLPAYSTATGTRDPCHLCDLHNSQLTATPEP